MISTVSNLERSHGVFEVSCLIEHAIYRAKSVVATSDNYHNKLENHSKGEQGQGHSLLGRTKYIFRASPVETALRGTM